MDESGGPVAPERGLAIHAVVRNTRTDRALDALHLGGSDLEYELVAAGGLAAAVTPAPFIDAGDPDPEALRRHERVVEALLQRSTLVPAPLGFLARDEAAVRELLRDHRGELEKALDYLENCYEVRVHVALRHRASEEDLAGFVTRLHGALRGQARAARRLPGRDDSELVAAFLVARQEWMRLVEKATRWEGHHPEVALRVTGPWPPYDFVSVTAGKDGREDEHGSSGEDAP